MLYFNASHALCEEYSFETQIINMWSVLSPNATFAVCISVIKKKMI